MWFFFFSVSQAFLFFSFEHWRNKSRKKKTKDEGGERGTRLWAKLSWSFSVHYTATAFEHCIQRLYGRTVGPFHFILVWFFWWLFHVLSLFYCPVGRWLKESVAFRHRNHASKTQKQENNVRQGRLGRERQWNNNPSITLLYVLSCLVLPDGQEVHLPFFFFFLHF